MIEVEKNLSNRYLDENVITQWVKPKGYDLSMCEAKIKMFGINLVIVIGEYSVFRKYVKFHDDYDIGSKDCGAIYVYTDENDKEMKRYIWMPSNHFKAEDYGTLCHELHHFTHQSLADRGILYEKSGEETFAYFQGYFMELIVKAFVELDRINKLEEESKKKKKDVKLRKTRRR